MWVGGELVSYAFRDTHIFSHTEEIKRQLALMEKSFSAKHSFSKIKYILWNSILVFLKRRFE